jgi:eukaryotic-like serine/threonine-protein kinase
MPKIFVSYRRQDSADVTSRLNDRLGAQFGRDSIFLDIDSIPFSVDFRKRLNEGIQQCDVLLAIIGDHWLTSSFDGGSKTGKRRLEDPDDYVRIEIESALSLGIPVVPVLVGRASMPSEADLPGGLKELAYKNAAEARSGPTFHDNVDRLIRGLIDLVTDKQALWESFQRTIDIAAKDPDLGLVGARKVLQRVVREVYERRIGEPAGTRPLEKIVERLVKERYLSDRFGTGRLINKDGGFDNPAKTITAAEAQESLSQLREVLKWYTEVEQPDGIGQLPARQRQPESTRTVRADQSPDRSITVVPKGLRSFDAHDADFFLDLLPGPRNKDGLPESIRFWKYQIESTDELTFAVGVIYGPSGCGKTSLVKAGLLPRLADRILTVYVETTAEETESRLLKALRKRCPGLPADLDLTATIGALRTGQGTSQREKVLIVVDQFEQWLHAKRQEETTELTQALRQCDGERVQALALVRDDFWVALSRFLAKLQIELREGQNIALVDLFDLRHAQKVLTAFGRAFGTLQDDLSKDQQSFLDQAVAGLAQDGRVISVRLALFADMVKNKLWTPATLKAVGGAEGVGVTFLEETFSAASANPRHRLHQKATRAVLKALLPEQGTDIKGNMRSRQALVEVSGYADRAQDFEVLIRILDNETRLITPTDPEGAESDVSNGKVETGPKFYQLTHDYLVPSLREWLTRKQKETRRGRAELRLTDRAAEWNAKPENRQLPSLWEFLNIWLLTDKRKWSAPQRKMMGRARRVHGTRSAIIAAVLAALAVSGVVVSRQIDEKRNADYAAALVEQLVAADIGEVPSIVNKLEAYRHWADRSLREQDAQAEKGSNKKLHLDLALLPVDATKAGELRDRLQIASPSEFVVVRDFLPRYLEANVFATTVVQPLWKTALDTSGATQPRFQAACALAIYARDDPHWPEIRKFAADRLVSLEASALVAWRASLRPAKAQLIQPLAAIYRDANEKEQPRSFAAETLADYDADQPAELFALLADAELFQFAIVFEKLALQRDNAVGLAEQELGRKPAGNASEDQKEVLAKRQANAAVALLRLGAPQNVWPLFKPSPDPRVRSYVIHLLSPLGADPQQITGQFAILGRAADLPLRGSSRPALLLALGQFTEEQLSSARLSSSGRQPLIEKLLADFENEPDAGLHSAIEWLLRKWDHVNRLEVVVERLKTDDKELQARKPSDKRQWYVNTQKQTFVIVDARAGAFQMGSPRTEPGRYPDESEHSRRIGRQFAIAAHEVTKSDFDAFQRVRPDIAKVNTEVDVKTQDSPQTDVTWYEAAAYCNWLSEQDHIDPKQWCYVPNKQGAYAAGMKAKDKFWELTGYRLPTEPEWEYACRAGTVTSRYYGRAEKLLPQYAWYLTNGENRSCPVGSLEPNDWGLFDMLGNAIEWCFDVYAFYPKQANEPLEDRPATRSVEDETRRVLRGGAFRPQPQILRSACRGEYAPEKRLDEIGFRPARTYP